MIETALTLAERFGGTVESITMGPPQAKEVIQETVCMGVSRGTVLTDRKEVYIDDLCVEENCRGQGIAKALYEYTCAWAKDLGCAFVTLNVWCGNEGAMKFYEKMGMTPRKIFMEVKL